MLVSPDLLMKMSTYHGKKGDTLRISKSIARDNSTAFGTLHRKSSSRKLSPKNERWRREEEHSLGWKRYISLLDSFVKGMVHTTLLPMSISDEHVI